MNLPFRIITNSRVPAFFGKLLIKRPFAAQTLGPFIFFPSRSINLTVLRHELRHVTQWYVITGVSLALLFVAEGFSWWLALAPFVMLAMYLFASFVAWISGESPYRGNWFEADARRHAGEK